MPPSTCSSRQQPQNMIDSYEDARRAGQFSCCWAPHLPAISIFQSNRHNHGGTGLHFWRRWPPLAGEIPYERLVAANIHVGDFGQLMKMFISGSMESHSIKRENLNVNDGSCEVFFFAVCVSKGNFRKREDRNTPISKRPVIWDRMEGELLNLPEYWNPDASIKIPR